MFLCGTSLRFWENKGWINEIYPYGWFQWYFKYWLGRRSEDDERQVNRWKRIVSKFRGKLVKMVIIKNKVTNGVAWRPVSHGVSPKGVFYCSRLAKIAKTFFGQQLSSMGK